MRTFTVAELIAHTGADPNVLRRLIDVGVVRGDVSSDRGRGHRRLFSYGALFETATALTLHAHGVPTAQVGRALAALRRLDEPDYPNAALAECWTRLRGWDPPAEAVFIFAPAPGGDLVFDLLIGRGVPLPRLALAATIIDLGAIVAKLRARTGETWPRELRRPYNDAVWAKVEDRARRSRAAQHQAVS
jgi:hypothetical protein